MTPMRIYQKAKIAKCWTPHWSSHAPDNFRAIGTIRSREGGPSSIGHSAKIFLFSIKF